MNSSLERRTGVENSVDESASIHIPVSACGWRVSRPRHSWSNDVMSWADTLTVPPPKAHEVRVKIFAAGVNAIDAISAVSGKSAQYPCGIGLEGAGVVECVGARQDCGLHRGDAVVVLAPQERSTGTFSSYLNVDCNLVVKIPNALHLGSPEGSVRQSETRRPIDFVEASAVPVAGVAAYMGLIQKLRIERDRSIFIHGGSGGIGSIAVQLSHRLGLTVITACSAGHASFVHRCGADVVVDYLTVSKIVESVLKLTGQSGVDFILDASGTGDNEGLSKMLRFGGAICVITTRKPIFDFTDMWQRQISTSSVSLLRCLETERGRMEWKRATEKMLQWYCEGLFEVYVEEVELHQAPSALDVVYGGHTVGKLVLYNFHQELLESHYLRRKAMKKYLSTEAN